MIELKNINMSYGMSNTKRSVLHDISLSFQSGQIAAIMGKSGCGKSTLLNIMAGLQVPDSGQYLIDNKVINFKSKKELTKLRREKISLIVQNFALIHNRTLLENIMLPVGHKGKQEALKYGKSLGLSDDILSRYPNQLSGGEQQRGAIARALVKKSEIILADEPTGSLDTTNEKIVMNIMRRLSQQGITVVIVTHDTWVAKQCDRIIEISDGRIVDYS